MHRAVLIVVFCRQHLVDICRAVLIDVALVHLPLVEVDGEVEIMLVGEVVAVVKFAVIHVHVRASRRAAQHDVAVLRRAYRTIVIRRCASVVVSADHCHSAQRELILVGCAVSKSGACKEVVAHAVVVGRVRLILVSV